MARVLQAPDVFVESAFQNNANYWILWDLINIILPILIAPLFMGIVVLTKSTDPRFVENGHMLTVIKDGQMGFVAVVLAPVMGMEMVGKSFSLPLAFCVLALFLCALFGGFIAALGAVYTTDRKASPAGWFAKLNHYGVMWLSLVILAIAAGATHYARWDQSTSPSQHSRPACRQPSGGRRR
jgi:hypothetical protein